VHEALGGAFPKRHHVDCGVFAIICKVLVLGRYIGKLHKSWPGGHVYMLVVVDKFTKWVEAALVTTQDSTAVINFIKSIIFRFGVPNRIITDNRTNFTSKEFNKYCESMGIKLKFASVAHLKTNG
jgi:hypothetical protein